MARKKTAQADVKPAAAVAVEEGVTKREPKGTLEDINGLLNAKPDELVELLSILGPEAIPMIKAMYDGFMGKYRPIFKMAPELVGMVGKDAAPIAAAVLTVFNELVNADEMKTAMAAMRKTTAANRKLTFLAYQNAGFTREEAFALVLQDVASAHSMAATAMRSISVSHK